MEIRISEKEITLGVVAYLNSRGMNIDPHTANIEFTVSRKPAGITAVLHEGPLPDVSNVTDEPKEQVLTGQAETDGVTLVSGEVAERAPEPEVAEAQESASIISEVIAQPALETGESQTGASLFG